jgi:hypothetical protein
MTERIKELAKEAGSVADATYAKAPDAIWLREYNKKFAELLVLECVNAVMDGSKEGDHYAMRIEQHFNNGQGGILHFGVE